MIMERETEKKNNIQVQLWMNQKDNRIANLYNLDDLQQKNKRGRLVFVYIAKLGYDWNFSLF